MGDRQKTGHGRDATAAVLLACAAFALTAAACGDDAATRPTATAVEESIEHYGTRIESQCPGSDPGFDPFLAEHPTPAAADWAAFLPAPLTMLTELRDCIATSQPPAELTAQVDAVVVAFDVVIEDFDKALIAARAGDLDTTNKWVTQMHDIDQPKIDEAISRVGVGQA